MKELDQIITLIRKDLREELTADEAAELQAWAASHPACQQLLDDVNKESWMQEELKAYEAAYHDQASIARMLTSVQQGIGQQAVAPLPRKWYIGYKKWMAAAAVVLILLTTGYLLLNRQRDSETPTQIAEIQPGTNKATLTLSNGDQVELKSAAGGIVVGQENIRYTDSTLLPVTQPVASAIAFNTLSTPQGGQYRIVLPDGSRVWLNALTKLRYPTAFASDRREVELEGEAYFEVAHHTMKTGKLLPFIVKSKGQEVSVLGTAFNINSYADEPGIRTTLVQGSVQVKNLQSNTMHKLQPGMQSYIDDAQTTIGQADVFSSTAWKDGLFSFRNASVEDLMKQLRRWYGVEVSFEGTIPAMRINGEVDRNMSANKVFEVLDYLEIMFRIENNHIIISNKK